MRNDCLRDAVDVRLRSCAELYLRQRGMFDPGLRERAREQSMTTVGTNPPRELPIKIVARVGGVARCRVSAF